MPNPHKGEVSFDAGGKSYTLSFSVDAICKLEGACDGRGIVALSDELSDMQRVSMTLLRKVMWAGLQEHHSDIDLKAAGELIVAAGGMIVAVGIIGKAFMLAFPQAKDGESPPPMPGLDGTGPAS